ncbi:DUF2567 domain-containing protein [Rhodococcus sp. NPDC058532]|uniref:DUF2567 domain-containing protein n=1 Tax=Rhodococcus sp. NPDC058532 TaxID=3346540 RepID=UPI00364EE8BF
MTTQTQMPGQRASTGGRRAASAEVRSAARVVAGVVVTSALAGIGWGLLAPAQHFLVVSSGGATSLTGESTHQFDAVALFLCLGAILGVLSAVAVWSIRAYRGVAQVIGLVLGSVVGASAAALVGLGVAQLRFPGVDDLEVGQIVPATPGLGTVMALIAQPFAAALVYLLLVSLSPRPDLGVEAVAPAAEAPRR